MYPAMDGDILFHCLVCDVAYTKMLLSMIFSQLNQLLLWFMQELFGLVILNVTWQSLV